MTGGHYKSFSALRTYIYLSAAKMFGGTLESKVVTVLCGAGGVGKSLFALSMALSMTSGRDLTGFVGGGSVDRRKVLMISNEDSEDELILRSRGICRGAGLSGEEEQVLKVLRAGIIRSEPLRLILAKQEVSPRPKQQPQQQRPSQPAHFGYWASWQDCYH